jgi:hypothetical protein
MITSLIIVALIFGLLGIVAVVSAIKKAPAGYQDAFGFHQGVDLQHDIALIVSKRENENKRATRKTSGRAKLAVKRASRDPVTYGTVFPLSH